MVTQQQLYEYAWKVYANFPDYSLEKARRLFPKYYPLIMWDYEKLLEEREQIVLGKILAYQQVVFQEELELIESKEVKAYNRFAKIRDKIYDAHSAGKDIDQFDILKGNSLFLDYLICRATRLNIRITNSEFLGDYNSANLFRSYKERISELANNVFKDIKK